MQIPCRNCPFRTDEIFPLPKDRREEIASALLADSSFACHKTTSFSDSDIPITANSKPCIGAAIFLEHCAPGGLRANFSFRLALWGGLIKLEKLDMNASVARSVEEFVDMADLDDCLF